MSSPATAPASAQLLARLEAKRAELDHLHEVCDLSEDLVAYFDEYQRHFDEMNKGTQGIADLLAHWSTVLRVAAFAKDAGRRPPRKDEPRPEIIRVVVPEGGN